MFSFYSSASSSLSSLSSPSSPPESEFTSPRRRYRRSLSLIQELPDNEFASQINAILTRNLGKYTLLEFIEMLRQAALQGEREDKAPIFSDLKTMVAVMHPLALFPADRVTQIKLSNPENLWIIIREYSGVQENPVEVILFNPLPHKNIFVGEEILHDIACKYQQQCQVQANSDEWHALYKLITQRARIVFSEGIRFNFSEKFPRTFLKEAQRNDISDDNQVMSAQEKYSEKLRRAVIVKVDSTSSVCRVLVTAQR